MSRLRIGKLRWRMCIRNKQRSSVRGQSAGEAGGTIIVERNETTVERGVPVHRQEQTVIWVEPFRIGCAGGPWLHMAGPQQLGLVEPSDRAFAGPEIHQRLSEHVLTDALHDKALNLGRRRKGPGFP